MTRLQQGGLAILVMAVLGATAWLAVMPDGPATPPRLSASMPGPDNDDGTLHVQILSGNGLSSRTARTQVEVTGSVKGMGVSEMVFRSQESPDMLRLGWASTDHLVIAVPQYPQDSGKPLGSDDASFACGAAKTSPIHVECEAYQIGPRR